jgi:ACT domain-containing protein
VFDDTSYTTCSFDFVLSPELEPSINTFIYNGENVKNIQIEFTNYIIGGEIYNLPVHPDYKIERLLIGKTPNTNILLKAIDDSNKIGLRMVEDKDIYYGKISSRTYASIIINPPVNKIVQEQIVERFNQMFNEHREKYNSLFLVNYRENKRKRVSFNLVYNLIGNILFII